MKHYINVKRIRNNRLFQQKIHHGVKNSRLIYYQTENVDLWIDIAVCLSVIQGCISAIELYQLFVGTLFNNLPVL